MAGRPGDAGTTPAAIIAAAREEGRRSLDEAAGKRLLAHYGIGVPRSAVVDGNAVLVATREGTLARRTVTVAWGDQQVASVRGELEDGDQVITSSIATPIEGMPVRVIGEAVGAAAPDAGDPESM